LTAKSVTLFFSRPNDLAVVLGILNIGNAVVAPGMVSTATAITVHPDEEYECCIINHQLLLILSLLVLL